MQYLYKKQSVIDRIKKVLSEKKIDIPTFRRELAISSQKWQTWKERGVPAEWIFPIAKYLGVSPEWLALAEENNHEIKEKKAEYYDSTINQREKTVLELFNALPSKEQDAFIRELEEKERYFQEIINDYLSKKQA